ncbi:DEAD/DEAH box helicase [Kribbella sp. NBC_01245]|uniref:DEAD/DEAH box helicase n=1 Tax=Kribbella sp. NBC_01245 TaxID=2903578 RepID=UPI002E280544|nr:DEAD/DEAH box helicase [Kribbella sp. NBC_01245]
MTQGTIEATNRLGHFAVAFQPADPPRNSRMAFWSPDGEDLPLDLGETAELVVDPGAGSEGVRRVVLVPVSAAVPVLGRARTAGGSHPTTAFWGTAALTALQLVARGRLLPGVSPEGYDAWRVGPLEASDVERIQHLAQVLPAGALADSASAGAGADPAGAVAGADVSGASGGDAEALVRAFLDAVADGMPRSPAAVAAHGTLPFAAKAPQPVPKLRSWSNEVSAGLDSGVRISLRLDLDRAPALSDGSDELTGLDQLSQKADSRFGEFVAVVQLHSLSDPTLVRDAREVWAGEVPGFGTRARIDTTLAIRRTARSWAPLARLLDSAVPAEMPLSDEEVGDLLASGAARLAAAGVDVHWPKGLERTLTARAAIGAGEAAPSDMPSFFGGDSTLTFSWQLALGDDPLTEAEMDALAEATRPVVRLRDQWVLIDPELARKARDRMLKPVTAIDALGAALTGATEIDGRQVKVSASAWLDELRTRIADPDRADDPPEAPAALQATLRDYQLRGLRWLVRMTSLGLGGCLADDMGLGKTITLIALHLHRQLDAQTSGPTLVVCPASLLGNWEREVRRFAPGVPVHRFHGTGRSLPKAEGGFVLTTYGTMRRDAARLGAHDWGLLVADEAQHVKNPSSGTAKALRAVPAKARVALTGTPVENNLSELWAILDWTTPGLLGRLSHFRSRWAVPIEADKDADTAERFAQLVRPFLLRRKKTDPGIAPELPPKTETDQNVSLTREQAVLYEATVRELMDEVKAGGKMARRGLIVKLLTGLKQICNHPAQYLKEPDTAKLTGRSGKLELLDELLATIVAEDGSVLIFTQYVAMARLLERHLAGRGIATQLLHGGTPVRQRDEMVERFQAGEVPVFLLSLKAAGTGLNLTRADHVVHFDRWWNPAVEDQATDRAYRIGQTRPVQVHRLIAEGTIEDRIAAMLTAKRDLADAVLTSGEAALTELSDDELADLVELRGAR